MKKLLQHLSVIIATFQYAHLFQNKERKRAATVYNKQYSLESTMRTTMMDKLIYAKQYCTYIYDCRYALFNNWFHVTKIIQTFQAYKQRAEATVIPSTLLAY